MMGGGGGGVKLVKIYLDLKIPLWLGGSSWSTQICLDLKILYDGGEGQVGQLKST